ncbi:hypothetical protein [Micromonospora humi]|uniref:hypothetical protein n=1 Tax=Micromonospora humi TaxID=745366 RepID=UPI000B8867C8|nr:hypothetical protein [Micromonospora humi]
MLPVAFASSTWTAMLRRIARTAVTTLALIAGMQGLAAAPADATTTPTTVAVVDVERPATTAAVDGVDATPLRPVFTTRATVVAPSTASATHTADSITTGPAVPARADDGAAEPVPGVEVVAAAEPLRAAIARRGPPRA